MRKDRFACLFSLPNKKASLGGGLFFCAYFLFFTAFTIQRRITEPMTAMMRL